MSERDGLSFKDKLKSIQFSAGAKTYPRNYYDSQALEQIGMDAEGREEHLEVTEGMPLRWRTDAQGNRTAYRKDKVGDYVKATEQDLDRVMYGSRRQKNRSG